MVVGRDVLFRPVVGVAVLLVIEHIGGICYLTVVRSLVFVLMPLSRVLKYEESFNYRSIAAYCRD